MQHRLSRDDSRKQLILDLLIYLYGLVTESRCKVHLFFINLDEAIQFFVVSVSPENMDDLLTDYSQISAYLYDMKNHFRFQAK
jgi:hypothetical protein